jgi:hypothetical protein
MKTFQKFKFQSIRVFSKTFILNYLIDSNQIIVNNCNQKSF